MWGLTLGFILERLIYFQKARTHHMDVLIINHYHYYYRVLRTTVVIVNLFLRLTNNNSTGKSNKLFIIHLTTDLFTWPISAHVFTANHITHLPMATLSIDQSNHSPAFLNIQLRLLESCERLLLATNVSTTCAEAIFKVKSHDSEYGIHTGCWNVSCKQQSFSGLQSPRWSFSIKVCYSWDQTIFFL